MFKRHICLAILCAVHASQHTMSEPPRFMATPVPVLEFSESSFCCIAESFCLAPGDIVLGSVGAGNVTIGMRGFMWIPGQDPVDLTGDAFTIAEPQFMNESGWIAGEASICPQSNGACDRVLFFISPDGTLIEVDEPSIDPLWIVDFTEEDTLIVQGDGVHLVETDGTSQALSVPKGAGATYARGATPDGSMIGGYAYIDGAKQPLRWIDGVLEILEIPDSLSDVTGMASDGAMSGSVWESEATAYHAIWWDPSGAVGYLPEPAGTTTSEATYIDEDLVVGGAMIDGMYNVMLWHRDASGVSGYTAVAVADDMAGGFSTPKRAGDLLSVPLASVHTYVPSLLLVSIDGDESRWCPDAVVIGDIEFDPNMGFAPNGAFTDPGSSSMLVNVGSWQTQSFLLERLRPGDVNGDRVVDGMDIAELLGNWGGFDPAADLDGDGIVSGADLSIALGDWG